MKPRSFMGLHQFRHTLVLVFFDEDTEDFHHGGERVAFVLACSSMRRSSSFTSLPVFAIVVRHAQSRLDLRPYGKRLFHLSGGHDYFLLPFARVVLGVGQHGAKSPGGGTGSPRSRRSSMCISKASFISKRVSCSVSAAATPPGKSGA